ncbi:MAG: hypothetical protein WD750_03725 [Gammaproteobacteria bacterium]
MTYETLKYPHDIISYNIVRNSHNNNALIILGWVLADIGKIQIAGDDCGTSRTRMGCNLFVSRILQTGIIDMLGCMAKVGE